MVKKCNVCFIEKEINEFYKHPKMSSGYLNKCKDCNKKQSKHWRLLKIDKYKEKDNQRYRFGINRIFSNRYLLLKNRCEKGSYGKKVRVTGMEYLSKEDFIKWCYEEKNYKHFISIYNTWVQNDFDRKLSPSIDRIDNNKSYTSDNIQWLSISDNIKKYYS